MRLVPALLLPLAVAACAPAAPIEATPLDSPFAPPAPSTKIIPCGEFGLPQGKGLPETAMRCIIDAAAQGRPAGLKETRPTVEGDPISTWYRVRADGSVEVTRDTTKDRFGNQGIVREVCTGPAAGPGVLTFTRCDPA